MYSQWCHSYIIVCLAFKYETSAEYEIEENHKNEAVGDVLGGAAAIPVTKAEYHKNPCQMQNKRITPNNNILIIIE